MTVNRKLFAQKKPLSPSGKCRLCTSGKYYSLNGFSRIIPLSPPIKRAAFLIGHLWKSTLHLIGWQSLKLLWDWILRGEIRSDSSETGSWICHGWEVTQCLSKMRDNPSLVHGIVTWRAVKIPRMRTYMYIKPCITCGISLATFLRIGHIKWLLNTAMYSISCAYLRMAFKHLTYAEKMSVVDQASVTRQHHLICSF